MCGQRADIEQHHTGHHPADCTDQSLISICPVADFHSDWDDPFGQIIKNRVEPTPDHDLHELDRAQHPVDISTRIVHHAGRDFGCCAGFAQAFDVILERANSGFGHQDIRSACRFHAENNSVQLGAGSIPHSVHCRVHLGQNFGKRPHIAVGIGDRHAQIIQRAARVGRRRGKARQDRAQGGATFLTGQAPISQQTGHARGCFEFYAKTRSNRRGIGHGQAKAL
ncbi:hypothetical protein ROE7235_03883 [Roseibaca ekhonensis]|uniref:Uncharacterized protein n=1 Tax=Roseinatronobacter ekhonensis TaxID=254356 RepID=A0A3B0ME07_9RHOB|nr:hypothetical protein ROE7235_03883 [Roseibaca ekhonensis]